MKIFLGALFCLSILAASSHSYANNICARLPTLTPEIKIIDVEKELEYEFGVSQKYLVDAARQYTDGASKLFIMGDTMGLTLGGYEYEKRMALGFLPAGLWGKVYCPRLESVVINFIYDSKIYIAKEYAPNKCAFDVIMGHELDHHQVNIVNKRKYIGWLKKDLSVIITEIYKKYGPVSYAQREDVYIKMQNEIHDVVKLYFDKMNRDKRVQNAKLDTPREYERLNYQIDLCYIRNKGY